MIQIGVATVRFSYAPLEESEFRRLGLSLFEAASAEAQARLRLDNVRVILEVREGSVRARTKIFAAAVSVSAFLSQYGSIRQGSEYLAKDVMTAGRAIISHVSEEAGVAPNDIISSRRSATLTRRIRHVVEKVESGKLSTDEATNRLVRLLDPHGEGAVLPDLLAQIDREVRAFRPSPVRRRPDAEQAPFPLTVVERYRATNGVKAVEPRLPSERPHKPKSLRVYVGPDDRIRVEEE